MNNEESEAFKIWREKSLKMVLVLEKGRKESLRIIFISALFRNKE